ncbi:hypothetical protein PENSPDRAFT_583177, partial [Peniophora sp. CONT]
QECHVHYLSTSTHASIPEQIAAVKSQIQATQRKPHRVQDARTGQLMCLRIFPNAEPSDNLMQDELTSHVSGASNLQCRRCMVGGTQEHKCTNDGYHSLFTQCEPRTLDYTMRQVLRQVSRACTGFSTHVESLQKETGVKDSYTQPWIDELVERARALRAEGVSVEDTHGQLWNWVTENHAAVFNPNLRMNGLDPHRDTPVELLHTILLGIIKYVWYHTHSIWKAEEKRIYALRLQSTDTHGLSIASIRSSYIMQFCNSLIGRQLKTVGQASIFHISDMLPTELFLVWKASGLLMALLWVPEIDDMAQYMDDVRQAVDNVLDAFAVFDPSKIIMKMKLHILVHTPDDIWHFGPLINEITEMYEAFNSVFRACSVHSNHLAPSRDIAIQLADQESLKHRITGGWMHSREDGTWTQAGPGVREFLHKNPQIQHFYGWLSQNLFAGFVRIEAVPRGENGRRLKRPTRAWAATAASKAINGGDYSDETALNWYACKHFTAVSGDECNAGTWVYATSPLNASESLIGRVVEVASSSEQAISSNTLVTIDMYELARQQRHPLYDMPRLYVPHGEQPRRMALRPEAVQFSLNVQHDCRIAGCTDSGERNVVQERVEINKKEKFIEHVTTVHEYIVNLHALHNAHLIRRYLPRNLTAPIPAYADPDERRDAHDTLAASLREERGEARAKKRALQELEAQADNRVEPGDMGTGMTDIEPREGGTGTGQANDAQSSTTGQRRPRIVLKLPARPTS